MREHAGFIALVGAAPIVVGGILISVGVVEATSGQPTTIDLWGNTWFLVGFIVASAGVLTELLAVGLYVGSRGTGIATHGTITQRNRRVVLNMSIVQLTQPFHAGYTNVQARNMVKQYLGQWLRITQPLSDVLPSGLGVMAVVRQDVPSGATQSCYAFFGRRWKARMEALALETTVSIEGKISEVDGYVVKLKRCRLVDDVA